MSTRIENIDPTHATREIGDTGQVVAFGETVEIENAELAASLLEQSAVWARPTRKDAKAAEREARNAPAPEGESPSPAEPGPSEANTNEGVA